jgi:hypothetical protein
MSKKRSGAEAAEKFIRAKQERQIAKEQERMGELGPFDHGTFHYSQAERLEEEAKELLKPAGEIVRGEGEAMDLGASDLNWNLIDTLKDPDSVSLGASADRMNLLVDADVLEVGLDAVKSAQAENSLEKMLLHQMAAAHRLAMKQMARANDDRLPTVEGMRLMNTAARLMQVFQNACLTLQRIRMGGKQTVVVQHVQVSDGGQAVIAASMKAMDRGGRRRGTRKNTR